MNRILIVSPNLEEGKCGVSDYSNVLKHYFLQRKGTTVYQLAISDKFVGEEYELPFQRRLPFATSGDIKQSVFKEAVEHFKPDCIIINFVSYGFSKKGLPSWFLKLNKVIGDVKLVFIFHELWPGNFSSEKLKVKIMGMLQKKLILKIIGRFKTPYIFVTTEISKRVLQHLNIGSFLLPVFSNISTNNSDTRIPSEMVDFFSIKNTNKETFNLVLFGSSSFPVDTKNTVTFFSSQIQQFKKCFNISFIGNQREADLIFKILKNNYSDSVTIKYFKHLPAYQVAYLFNNSDYGITSYMPEFWSKSGAIAAMLAHELPVISIAAEAELGLLGKEIELPKNILRISRLNSITKRLPQNKMNGENYNDQIFEQLYLQLSPKMYV